MHVDWKSFTHVCVELASCTCAWVLRITSCFIAILSLFAKFNARQIFSSYSKLASGLTVYIII